jgi:uncharacterized delta-60 repeat protein
VRTGARIRTLAVVFIAAVAWPSGALALSPGTLDPTFGSGGTLLHQFGADNPFGAWSEGFAVAVQPNGKIVTAGVATASSGANEILVVRLNADGSLDSSFGTGGVVTRQVGQGASPTSFARSLAIQNDGKIVIAGRASDSNGHGAVMVARLNPDGSLDSSFNSTGVLVSQQASSLATSPFSEADSVMLQGSKILLGGHARDSHSKDEFMVVRLNSDGSFDSAFGSGGVVLQQLGSGGGGYSDINSLAIQADGKIVAAGAAGVASQQEFLVARLDGSNGSFDSSFGSGGTVIQQLGTAAMNPFSVAFGLAVQANGKIVAGGELNDATLGQATMLARLNSDGSFDSTFGSHGVVSTQLGSPVGATPAGSYIQNLVLQPNGKIVTAVFASSDTNDLEVARFNSDGSLDSAFGSGGVVQSVQGAGFNSDPDGLALQPDGKILASGEVSASATPSTAQLFVTRLIGDPVPTPSIDASPNPAIPGQTISFSGSSMSDPNGAIPSYGWSFGDGANATGANPQHAYAQPGSYKVTLTVTYDDGVISSATKTIVVPSVQLSGVSQSHRSWREGTALPHVARAKRPPVGTTFRFKVNQAATMRFAFTQKVPGRKVGHLCVAPSKKNAHKPKCTRTVTRGKLSFSVGAGVHKVRFDGRLSKHKKLARGRYTLIITASNGAGPPATKKLTFTIVSG